MPLFKDEHVLMIAPGSQTTLAQLGLPESYTPARLRVYTRMFPAEKTGEWEPIKVREKKIKKTAPAPSETERIEGDPEDEVLYEEDPRSDEGAVYPLCEGRIVNWPCLFALLTHIYNTLSPPFHTPILLVAQPSWTLQDHEAITQFFFEKFKTPAFALVDHAIATIYAYNAPTATVIDVGYEKCDVTAVSDFAINDIGRGVALPNCGGKHMTDRLEKLLASKGFTREMSEQLKRSHICEVLPPNTPFPTQKDEMVNPAAAASTGVNGTAPPPKNAAAAANGLPRGPGLGTEVGAEDLGDDEEGILDVASLVTSGKTSEFLARKEREKAERAAARRGGDAPLPAKATKLPNSARAKNTFHFTEETTVEEDAVDDDQMQLDGASSSQITAAAPEVMETSDPAPAQTATMDVVQEPEPVAEDLANTTADSAEAPTEAPKELPLVEEPTISAPALTSDVAPSAPTDESTETATTNGVPATGEATVNIIAPPSVVIEPPAAEPPSSAQKERTKVQTTTTIRHEMEVGIERFRAADDGMLDQIADTVHRCILSVPEISKRSELWDSLVILGNGSKVRGFKDALVATLNTKYLISPSSATIFTSELPSNMSTPAGTGANTPQPQSGPPPMHHSSGVNPLLIAATTASNPALAPPGSVTGAAGASTPGGVHSQQHAAIHHSSHGQTPTSIRLAKMAEYFPEWKESGFDEAHFLGAQVAAKILFIIDQGASKGFMSRTEYNDLGPQGIHEFAMC